MSHNTLTVNGVAPTGDNVEVTLSSALPASPSQGQIPRLDGSWEAIAPSASTPLGLSYSQHSNGNTSWGVGTYNYSSTYWAYEFNNRSVLNLATGVSQVTATAPPAPVTSSNFIMAVTLPAGTYFVRAVPSISYNWGVFRLYHTATNNTGGVYFGNSVYILASDGKTGSTVMGVTTFTTTRRLFIRLVSESTRLAGPNSFITGSFNVRKIA